MTEPAGCAETPCYITESVSMQRAQPVTGLEDKHCHLLLSENIADFNNPNC